jgi:hypothetical protein
MISPERSAALYICTEELGLTNIDHIDTDELWQTILKTHDSYARWIEGHTLNDGKPWWQIRLAITTAPGIEELMKIYNSHPKLQKHKQFLEYLSKRKKQILK